MSPRELVGQAWHWIGPTLSTEDDSEPYYELRIAELPDFYLAARTKLEARVLAAQALEAFLDSYRAEGKEVPRPTSVAERPASAQGESTSVLELNMAPA